MKLLVIGAGGETGEAVVEQALAVGHEVTAFVHSPADYKRTDVRIVTGDARDRALMVKAVQGQEAVLDTLGGHLPFLNTTLEADTALNVIEAMKETGVRRLIVLSTIGEGESASNVHSYYKHLFMTTLLRGVMKDKAGLEDAVRHSDLDWIVVRPAGLSHGDPKGIRIVKPETGEKVRFITRSDVAHFMLQQVDSSEYLHQAVGIANPEE
jgi:putative NADH-flavin reductase